MADAVVFAGCNVDECRQLAEQFSAAGWDALCVDAEDSDGLEAIVQHAPVAAVFLLGERGEVVHDLALAVLADERLTRPLMVFAGGEPEDLERARSDVPYGVFVRPDELAWVLKHLVYKQ